jgi:signal transduction histidine kinase
VSELYPDDQLLVDLGAVSYLGQMIFDADRVPLGYVFAMHDRPEDREIAPLHDFVDIVASWVGDQLMRRASDDTLRANEATFRGIFSNAQVAIGRSTVHDGRLVQANDAFARMFGYTGCADDIFKSGQHLLAIINDILDLAKIDAGAVELHEEPVDLDDLYRASAVMLEQKAGEAGVTLRAEIDPALPPIRADQLKLQQVLVNLLSNAVKFTLSGGDVVFSAGLEDTGDIRLAITDSGIGMAPADIPKALLPFQQIDSRLCRKYDGTGLGLPLAKRLAELHGGTVEIESEKDRGTCVTIRLPKSRCLSPEAVSGDPAKRTGTAASG